jgi:hypothetical protein
MLYSKSFWNIMMKRWRKRYFEIRKVNDITLNFGVVKGITGLNELGRLALVKVAGGQVEMFNLLKDFKRRGKLSDSAYKSIRKVIKSACNGPFGLTTTNDCILELDSKVEQAYEMFRDGGNKSNGTEQENLLTIKN